MRSTVGNRRVSTWRKFAGLVSAFVLVLSIFGAGTASAANPAGWTAGHGTDSSLAQQPGSGASSSVVSSGHTVGFFEWLRNSGPRNISQLFDVATTSAEAVGGRVTVHD